MSRGNQTECRPLLVLLVDGLQERGKILAQALFGADRFIVHYYYYLWVDIVCLWRWCGLSAYLNKSALHRSMAQLNLMQCSHSQNALCNIDQPAPPSSDSFFYTRTTIHCLPALVRSIVAMSSAVNCDRFTFKKLSSLAIIILISI